MNRTSEDKTIIKEEEKLEKDISKIEDIEDEIEDHEKEIIGLEKNILKHSSSKKFPKEFKFLKALFLKRIAKHRLLYTLAISLGIVLVWRGIWETTLMIPILSYPIVALVVGIIILWLTEKYSELK